MDSFCFWFPILSCFLQKHFSFYFKKYGMWTWIISDSHNIRSLEILVICNLHSERSCFKLFSLKQCHSKNEFILMKNYILPNTVAPISWGFLTEISCSKGWPFWNWSREIQEGTRCDSVSVVWTCSMGTGLRLLKLFQKTEVDELFQYWTSSCFPPNKLIISVLGNKELLFL